MNRLLTSQKFRRIAIQSSFVFLIAVFIISLVVTGQRNIAAQGIATGFGFLERTTGWPVNFSVIEISPRSTYALVLWAGLINTMLVGFLTLIFSTILGLDPCVHEDFVQHADEFCRHCLHRSISQRARHFAGVLLVRAADASSEPQAGR